MERKRNINSVIHDQLLGRLSEEERKRLQVWIESSLENKKNYECLMHGTDLAERYRLSATVDGKIGVCCHSGLAERNAEYHVNSIFYNG